MQSVDSDVLSLDEETSLSNDCCNDFASDKKSSSSTTGFDEPDEDRPELKFDKVTETKAQKAKRKRIEEALKNPKTSLKTWRQLAIEEYGLVGDDLRRKIWPRLMEVDPSTDEKAPSLTDLRDHSEYNQVLVDVNRSLKRFPPGIPYKQRVALQDQLTVLILRVIKKYPHLCYYQGYHDVAITFLLVVGETVAYRIMEKLSIDQLKEFMEPTMETTNFRLNYIYPLLQKVDLELYAHLDSAGVGTIFALPWFLTWFGHSLSQYRDVVRLYDYFLASPNLMALYVIASLVIERREVILITDCDMPSLHCLLSEIPDDLDFEEILKRATALYKKYPPDKLEKEVKKRIQKELEERRKEELLIRERQARSRRLWTRVKEQIPTWLTMHYKTKYGLLVATATVVCGMYAYYKNSEGMSIAMIREKLGIT